MGIIATGFLLLDILNGVVSITGIVSPTRIIVDILNIISWIREEIIEESLISIQ
jgi:hypothetical protein